MLWIHVIDVWLFFLLEWELPGFQKELFYDGKTQNSFLKCNGRGRGGTFLAHLSSSFPSLSYYADPVP